MQLSGGLLVVPMCALAACTARFDLCSDTFEPNDTEDTAAPLSFSASAESQLCPGEDDWYRFALDAGDEVRVSIDYVRAAAILELELRGPDGRVVAAAAPVWSASGLATEILATRSGAYGLRVFARAGDQAIAYDLDLVRTPASGRVLFIS